MTIICKKYAKGYVGIVGLGRTGIASIRSLLLGDTEVVAYDDNVEQCNALLNLTEFSDYIQSKKLHIRPFNDDDWSKFDAVLFSPGIPSRGEKEHPYIGKADERGIKIITDIDLLFSAKPNAIYIGVTGTNGKSTTTALIEHFLKYYHVFHKTNLKVQKGGNIGIPALDLDPDTDVFVLELSSFQLDLMSSAFLSMAVCLNITQDHLDRYGNMENYANSKRKIFRLLKEQKDGIVAIIGVDDPYNKETVEHRERYMSKYVKVITISNQDSQNANVSSVKMALRVRKSFGMFYIEQPLGLFLPHCLDGRHNAQNVAASVAVTMESGANMDLIVEALPSFQGLPHRMEEVLKTPTLLFIDDSKATNLDSALYALEIYKNSHWIFGGLDDHSITDFTEIDYIFMRNKGIYLVGDTTDRIAALFDKVEVRYKKCYTIENALIYIKEHVTEGTILLSPACKSFDQWKNYEERGNFFARKVREMFGVGE